MLQLGAKASSLHPGPPMPALSLRLGASPFLISGLPARCSQSWVLGTCLGPLPRFPVHHRGNPASQIHLLIKTPKTQTVWCRASQQTPFLDPVL